MKVKDKVHTAPGALGGGTRAVFSAPPLHFLRTFRFLQQWHGYCINMLQFSLLAEASCATSGQGLRGGGCGHLELSGGGGSHGWNYLIRTGIQPRTKATSCFGYYHSVPLLTPVKESERC